MPLRTTLTEQRRIRRLVEKGRIDPWSSHEEAELRQLMAKEYGDPYLLDTPEEHLRHMGEWLLHVWETRRLVELGRRVEAGEFVPRA